MQDAVFVVNAANRIVDANPSAKRLAGNEISIGDSLAETFPSSQFPELDEIADARTECTFEIDGETRHFAIQLSPLTDSRGRQTGQLIVLRDITQLKTGNRN